MANKNENKWDKAIEALAPVEELPVQEVVAPVLQERKVKVTRLTGNRGGKVLIKAGASYRWLPVIQVPNWDSRNFEMLEVDFNKLAKSKFNKK